MQKWDMLLIDLTRVDVTFYSTNPEELKQFVEMAIHEAHEYFSYVKDMRRKLDIRILNQSRKGHVIEMYFFPNTDNIVASKEAIFTSDLKYFLLNIAISRNWLPYPGDGEGNRFIRYNE